MIAATGIQRSAHGLQSYWRNVAVLEFHTEVHELLNLEDDNHLPQVPPVTGSDREVEVCDNDKCDTDTEEDVETIYQIYYSRVQELVKANILKISSMPLHSLQVCHPCDSHVTRSSMSLWSVAEASAGLSVATVRKIPFLALANFCDRE